jgi:hypothetical protein
MKNKIKQKIAAVSSLILGLTFGLPNQPAQATGSGCSPFDIASKTCIKVVGTGLKVNSFEGWFNTGFFDSDLCNWYYSIKLYDSANNKYSSVTGPIHYSCNGSGNFYYPYSSTKPYNAKAGRACAELHEITNGHDNYVDAACVNITP